LNNFTQPGEVITFTAPTGGVVSGSAYLIGSLLVIATKTVAQTLPFEAMTGGVVDVPKVADEVWTECLKIYWDDTAKKFTLDDDTGSNPLVGVAILPIVTITVGLATSALAADLLISGLTLQVLDYVQLGTDNATVTVTINGVATVLTEGTDWTASVSDDSTATSLAAAIAALVGVAAAAVTDTVTVTPGTGSFATASGVGLGRVRLDGAAR
jgi:predicted RecA/RadA family phage recombinase